MKPERANREHELYQTPHPCDCRCHRCWCLYDKLIMSSIIYIFYQNLYNVLLTVVLFEKLLPIVFFIVWVHVVNFLYPCLLYDLCAAKTWVHRSIQLASSSFQNPYLQNCWLLSMQTQTLVKPFVWIGVAPMASIIKTGLNSPWSSVVPGRNHSIVIIDNNGSHRAFHAVRPSSGNICDFHEILVIPRPEWSGDILNICGNGVL